MNECGKMMQNIEGTIKEKEERKRRTDSVLKVIAEFQNKAKDASAEEVIVLAIDGRCASGKTTMAQELAEITGAGVIHMDDFFLPMELRTGGRLAEPGGNVHYERFTEEILPKLRGCEAFTYRRFDCRDMKLGDMCMVPKVQAQIPLRIVEGAYSCHPIFAEYADIKVFCDVENAEQLRRIRQRNGEEGLKRFQEVWIPMEEAYFGVFHIKEKADITL